MREINLRFWDKRENSYVENPFYLDILPIDDGFEMVSSVDLDDESTFVPEQCTGLMDENDHEIYEGDIVRVANIDGGYAYTDVVRWCGEEDYPAFDLKRHSSNYDSNALSEILAVGIETIEVIGNIHENPELLEVKP